MDESEYPTSTLATDLMVHCYTDMLKKKMPDLELMEFLP